MSIEPFIKCSDIKTSLHFYSQILDFKVIQAPDPDPEAFLKAVNRTPFPLLVFVLESHKINQLKNRSLWRRYA